MKGENYPGQPLCQAPTIDTWKKQHAENHRKPREGSTELPGENSYNISWSYKAVPTNGPYGPYKALYGNPVISDMVLLPSNSHPCEKFHDFSPNAWWVNCHFEIGNRTFQLDFLNEK